MARVYPPEADAGNLVYPPIGVGGGGGAGSGGGGLTAPEWVEVTDSHTSGLTRQNTGALSSFTYSAGTGWTAVWNAYSTVHNRVHTIADRYDVPLLTLFSDFDKTASDRIAVAIRYSTFTFVGERMGPAAAIWDQTGGGSRGLGVGFDDESSTFDLQRIYHMTTAASGQQTGFLNPTGPIATHFYAMIKDDLDFLYGWYWHRDATNNIQMASAPSQSAGGGLDGYDATAVTISFGVNKHVATAVTAGRTQVFRVYAARWKDVPDTLSTT